MSEVRIKLHITKSGDTTVRNLWMCLNYNQKPTVEHIIEHINQNYCQSTDEKLEIKLYLDDYWLPPYENSRLIRENDCVKVELRPLDAKKPEHLKESKAQKEVSKNLNDFADKLNLSKQYDPSSLYSHNLFDPNTQFYQQQQVYYYNNQVDPSQYYTDYYKSTLPEPEKNNEKLNLNKNTNLTKAKTNTTSETTTATNKPQNQKQAPVTAHKQTQSVQKSGNQANTSKKEKQSKEVVNCHKKFAIGSYVHLLNENVNEPERDNDSLSEEQIIDDYYQTLQKTNAIPAKTNGKNKESQKAKKSNSETTTASSTTTSTTGTKQFASGSVNIDKIATSINNTGMNKWKNSNKSTSATNGPKHIRFSSSSSSSSASESSSSSSSEEETEQQTKKETTQKQTKKNTQQESSQKKYYEPSKEDQLNAVNYNRSFVVQNPKNLDEFKKTFNQTKLNAPKAEEFADNNQKETETVKVAKTEDKNLEKSPEPSSPRKANRRSPSPKVDYEKLTPLTSAPRVNDKIAFQILEISSNFTPEISKFKHGQVVEFDSNTNEVTLKLYSKYNSILKKASKFSVVFDETEEEVENLKKNELTESVEPEKENPEDDFEDMLKVDWRNLMNIKLLSNETI